MLADIEVETVESVEQLTVLDERVRSKTRALIAGKNHREV
jgi:hypothetical protein